MRSLASLDSERAGHRPGESGAQPAQAGCGCPCQAGAVRRSRGAVPPCEPGQARHRAMGVTCSCPQWGDALGIRGSAGGSASPSRGRGTFATLLAYPLDPGATWEREGNPLGRKRERRGKGVHLRAGESSGGANGLGSGHRRVEVVLRRCCRSLRGSRLPIFHAAMLERPGRPLEGQSSWCFVSIPKRARAAFRPSTGGSAGPTACKFQVPIPERA